jgi:hypothetical protein
LVARTGRLIETETEAVHIIPRMTNPSGMAMINRGCITPSFTGG